jgi:hypothetical protein
LCPVNFHGISVLRLIINMNLFDQYKNNQNRRSNVHLLHFYSEYPACTQKWKNVSCL